MHLLLATIALLTVAGLQQAEAWTFKYDNFHLEPYTHEGYRLLPSWRIGVFSSNSVPARYAPTEYEPSVHVEATITGTEGRHAYFVMYSVHSIEQKLYDGQHSAHLCMDAGQATGVANPDTLREHGSIVLTATASEDDASVLHIRQSASVISTSFYAFGFVTCRYRYYNKNNMSESLPYIPANSPPDQWERKLDTGSNNTVINGQVSVMNPYGHAPGQSYGFVPFYAIMLVYLLILFLVFIVGMVCAGARKVVMYHWCLIAAIGLSVMTGILYVAYIGEINERDKDITGIYVMGYLFQRLRDGCARLTVLFIVGGIGITRGNLTTRELIASITYGCMYMFVGIIELIATETAGQRVLALAAVSRLEPGPRQWGVIVLEALLNISVLVVFVYYSKKTIPVLEKESPKRMLVIATTVVGSVFGAIGFIFALATIADGQYHERASEKNWELWWFRAAFMDLLFAIALLFLSVIWFPRNATLNLRDGRYADTSNYDGIRHEAGARPPAVNYGNEEEAEMAPRRTTPPPPTEEGPSSGKTGAEGAYTGSSTYY